MARAAINVVRPALTRRDHVGLLAEPGLGAISADSARLHQIIWNLLSNAVKFTPQAERFTIRVEQDGIDAR